MGETDPDGVSNRDKVALMLSTLAVAGNIDAIKIVLDRTDGKVPEVHTVDGRVRIALSWDDGSSE